MLILDKFDKNMINYIQELYDVEIYLIKKFIVLEKTKRNTWKTITSETFKAST